MTFEELKFTFKDAEYATAKPGSGHVDHMISVNEANRILSEKLKMAPEVIGNVEFDSWGSEGLGPLFPDTHKARLVCIEEIK